MGRGGGGVNRKNSYFVVFMSDFNWLSPELIFGHPRFYAVCACIDFFGELGHLAEKSGISGAVCHPRKAGDSQSGQQWYQWEV